MPATPTKPPARPISPRPIGRPVAIALAILLAAGCAPTRSHVQNESDGRHVYVTLRNPENIFKLTAENRTYSAALTNALASLTGQDAQSRAQFQATITQLSLAEQLDQLNAQVLAQYKAAVLGLNANPTRADQREAFWRAIADINTNIHALRVAELKRAQNQRIQLGQQVYEAEKAFYGMLEAQYASEPQPGREAMQATDKSTLAQMITESLRRQAQLLNRLEEQLDADQPRRDQPTPP